MPFVSGFLRVRSGGHPDNELPGSQPGIDNSLPGEQPGIDNELPPAPPGVFPPPTISNPIVPIPPGTSIPPGTIWPTPPGIDNTLPTPRPPTPPSGGVPTPPIYNTYWMLCYTPNHGWKYVAVDPSLRPDNALPPHAQPK
jgi:hypothetical protein